MAIIKTWGIQELEIRPDLFGNQNVVTAVIWTLTVANDGMVDESMPAAITLHGIINLDVPNETFIPYENLTQEQVIQWVKTALGPTKVDELERHGVQYCINVMAPNPTRPPLPWNT